MSKTATGSVKEIDYGYGDGAPVDYGYGDSQVDYGYGDGGPSGAVDYGYGDSQADYGYGDGAPSSAADYGYGDGAPSSAAALDYGDGAPSAVDYGYGDTTATAKQQQQPEQAPSHHTTKKKSHKHLKNKAGGGGLGDLLGNDTQRNNEDAAGGPKKKGRGRRLSMFAFAGQDDEMDKNFASTHGGVGTSNLDSTRVAPNKNNNNKFSSENSKGSFAHAPAYGGGGGVRRTLSSSDDEREQKSHQRGAGGLLGSFFLGGGSGGGASDHGGVGGGGAGAGGKRRGGRRLSMIAFAGGGEPAEEVQQQEVAAPPPGQRSNPPSRRPGASRRGGDDLSQSRSLHTSKYANVQLPKEFLADFNASRPTTIKMGAGSVSAAVPSSNSSYQGGAPTPAPAPSSAGAGAAKQVDAVARAGRMQRRSSFGGSTLLSAAAQQPGVFEVHPQYAAKAKQTPKNTTALGSSSGHQLNPPAAPPPGPVASTEPRKVRKQPINSGSSTRKITSSRPPTTTTATATTTATTATATNRTNGTAPSSLPPQQQSSKAPARSGSPAKLTSNSSHLGPSLDTSSTHAKRSYKPSFQEPEFKPKSTLASSAWSVGQQEMDQDGLTTAGDFNRKDQAFLTEYMQSMEQQLGGGALNKGSTHLSSASSHSGGGATFSSSSSSVSSVALLQREAAAITREFAAATAVGSYPNYDNMSLLYILARCCEWDAVLEEVQLAPRDAKVVSEKDGTTALHLAVMSRTNPLMRDGKTAGAEPAPLNVIEALVEACPEAAIIRCTNKKYTPLCYACLVADANYDMEDCCQIVQILLKHCPQCAFVFTDDGFSALDIHILSYSQLHKHRQEVYSGAQSSTTVLKALLQKEPSLADARVYRNKIRGPLELLYRCNIDEFKEAVQEEAGEMDDAKQEARIARFGNVQSVLSDWWAWKWALMLLKYASISAGLVVSPFNAVQAAARLVGCPLPILALAVSTFPNQVMDRDPTGDIYNLPLHEVCSWRADTENVAGDPFIATRKFKAMRLLLEQFPEGARMTNNCGETPLQLAVETCTPWHGGLELLVESCPKALKFPRKLRITDNGLALAVANHSAIDSLATVDSDEPDPLEPLENMYPFLVAAVLGGVSKNKRRPPVSFSDEMAEEHYANLERKSLQAVRAVYGLLRARPEVLQKYRQYMKKVAQKGK